MSSALDAPATALHRALNTTFTRFLLEEQRRTPGATGDFTGLISDVITACKAIAYAVNRGQLMGVLGAAESENIQGEMQKKLDIIANELLIQGVSKTGHLAGLASEEMEEIYPIPSRYPKGKYLLLFDPLDGSSNTDVNVSVGTIFSVLKNPAGSDSPSLADFLQPGREQVCAGYVIYGPATMLVFTNGQGVNGFTLDTAIGEFVLTHPQMRIPEQTQEFAINASNQRHWEPPVQRYVAECLQGVTGPRQQDFNMRWIASMVAEAHRILTRGGIFMYPRDNREPRRPGRLRLLYEANPVGMIIQQAGGAVSTGEEPILSLTPKELHQRVPLIFGSKNEVERVVQYHAQYRLEQRTH